MMKEFVIGKSNPIALRIHVVALVGDRHSHRQSARYFDVSSRFADKLVIQTRKIGSLRGGGQGVESNLLQMAHGCARLVQKGKLIYQTRCASPTVVSSHIANMPGAFATGWGRAIKKLAAANIDAWRSCEPVSCRSGGAGSSSVKHWPDISFSMNRQAIRS
ncbi:hypothetical protein [Ensifer sp.]|jgi:hypothetical protein|uniref:hypothetical protein n=1 Tax=Ensifer sp. TaxID=1872086 RepID=UPI002E10BA7F|nr:hypothetical protein [Ensifer sp.]